MTESTDAEFKLPKEVSLSKLRVMENGGANVGKKQTAKESVAKKKRKSAPMEEELQEQSFAVKTLRKLKHARRLHKRVKALVINVTDHELEIEVDEVGGNVHITNMGCTEEGVVPTDAFRPKQIIKVYITKQCELQIPFGLGPLPHQKKLPHFECSLKYPIPSPTMRDLRPGTSVYGYVKEFHGVSATFWLNPTQTGVLPLLHFPGSEQELRNLQETLRIGQCYKVEILSVQEYSDNSSDIILTMLDNSRPPEVGDNIIGLARIFSVHRGIILTLANGYQGTVCLTDICDYFDNSQFLFTHHKVNRFSMCHVLAVNHTTKSCILSLRKSRLCDPQLPQPSIRDPEITEGDLIQGKILSAFVIFIEPSSYPVASTVLIINIGRNIFGRVMLHHCKKSTCRFCSFVCEQIPKYDLGDVVRVIIKGQMEGNLHLVSLAEMKRLEAEEMKWRKDQAIINWFYETYP